MNMLEWIKETGKTLIIRGPQGCGKNLLAKSITGDDSIQVTGYELDEPFNGFMSKASTIIVEEWPDIDFGNLKRLITSQEIRVIEKMKEPKTIKTPQFIFCTSNKDVIPVDKQDRRFFIIDMDVQL